MTDISNPTPIAPDDGEPEEVEVDMVDSGLVERARIPSVGVFDMTRPSVGPVPEPPSCPAAIAPIQPLEPAFLELDEARDYLRRNELDQALAVAKEVSRQYPALPAARTIMARCFINRKEYRKALAILNAISDADKTAEAYYYLGLCYSRLHDIPKAVTMLEKSVRLSDSDVVQRPAQDLLAHLRGGAITCPECGQQSRYDAMVDIGDMTVCSGCAHKLLNESPPAAARADAAVSQRLRRRKGTFAGMIGRRVVTLLILLFLVYLGMYAASIYVPRQYENVRAHLPAGWTFLPKTGRSANSIAESSEHAGGRQSRIMLIDSPAIEYAIAGVPLVHRLSVDGMRGADGNYDALFSPQPKGRYRFVDKIGEFTWIPAKEDAGKRFDVTFGVSFRTARTREQINRIRVYSPPSFRTIYTRVNAAPGEISHLFAADVTDDAVPDIITVSGGAWSGQITVLQETMDGYFHPFSRAELDGRPAGAGLIDVNGETWLSIADSWNGTLRYFAVQKRKLQELSSLTITLPGKPVAAASDKASGVTVALCRQAAGMRLAWYRAVDAAYIEKDREWALPAGHVWRKVLMLPESPMAGLRPRALLVGGDIEKSLFLATLDKGELTHVQTAATGKIIDAALGHNGTVAVLVANDNKYELLRFGLNAQGKVSGLSRTTLGDQPYLNGMVGLNAFGAKDGNDIALLSAGKLRFAFSDTGDSLRAAEWDLPSPSGLMGHPTVLAGNRGEPDRVVFQSDDGCLWSAGLTYGGGE